MNHAMRLIFLLFKIFNMEMMIDFVPEIAWTEDFYLQYMVVFSFDIISSAQMAIFFDLI